MKRITQTLIQAVVLGLLCLAMFWYWSDLTAYKFETHTGHRTITTSSLPLSVTRIDPHDVYPGTMKNKLVEGTPLSVLSSPSASTTTSTVIFSTPSHPPPAQSTSSSPSEAQKYQDSVITSLADDAPVSETLQMEEINIIPGMKAGKANLAAKASSYVASIMDASNTDIERLECSAPATDRYDYLKWENSNVTVEYDDKNGKVKPRYFIALDLYKCVDLLPRLMGTIVEAVTWLGPANVVVSVVEGRSGK